MADTEKRSLKIKANTVNRIVKELQMYENDLVKEQGKYEALKDQGADAHDLKYAVRLGSRQLISGILSTTNRRSCSRRRR